MLELWHPSPWHGTGNRRKLSMFCGASRPYWVHHSTRYCAELWWLLVRAVLQEWCGTSVVVTDKVHVRCSPIQGTHVCSMANRVGRAVFLHAELFEWWVGSIAQAGTFFMCLIFLSSVQAGSGSSLDVREAPLKNGNDRLKCSP